MIIEDFNSTVDRWINELKQYSSDQILLKPDPKSWSIGQVYMHLIDATDYFIKQAEICMHTNDHATEESSPDAKKMFSMNDFPDKILEGPPSNAITPQPLNIDQLMSGLLSLKNQANSLSIRIARTSFKGKTKHPGLNYFNASEWLQFAEMHLRHHFRQKKRIDVFLEKTLSGKQIN